VLLYATKEYSQLKTAFNARGMTMQRLAMQFTGLVSTFLMGKSAFNYISQAQEQSKTTEPMPMTPKIKAIQESMYQKYGGMMIGDEPWPKMNPNTYQILQRADGMGVVRFPDHSELELDMEALSPDGFRGFIDPDLNFEEQPYRLSLATRKGFSDSQSNPITHSVVLIEKPHHIGVFGLGNTGFDKRGQIINDTTDQPMRNDYTVYGETTLEVSQEQMSQFAKDMQQNASSRYHLTRNNCFSTTSTAYLRALSCQPESTQQRCKDAVRAYSADNNKGLGMENNADFTEQIQGISSPKPR